MGIFLRLGFQQFTTVAMPEELRQEREARYGAAFTWLDSVIIYDPSSVPLESVSTVGGETSTLVPQVPLFRQDDETATFDSRQSVEDNIRRLIRDRYKNSIIARTVGRSYSVVNLYRRMLISNGETNIPIQHRIASGIRYLLREGIYTDEQIADAFYIDSRAVQTIRFELEGRRQRHIMPIEIQQAGEALHRLPISVDEVAEYMDMPRTIVQGSIRGENYLNLDSLYDALLACGFEVGRPEMQQIDQLRRDFNAFLFFAQPSMTSSNATQYLIESAAYSDKDFAGMGGIHRQTIQKIRNDGKFAAEIGEIILDVARVDRHSKAGQLFFQLRAGITPVSIDTFISESFKEELQYYCKSNGLRLKRIAELFGVGLGQASYYLAVDRAVPQDRLARFFGSDNVLYEIMLTRLKGERVTLDTDQRMELLNMHQSVLFAEHIEQAQRYQ